MFRTIAGLAAAALALMPFVEKPQVAAPTAVQQQAVDPFETASLKGGQQRVYEISATSGAHCRLSVEDKGGIVPVHAEAACRQVYSGLERVSHWTPGVDGRVRLIDSIGNLVAEIGVSDGFAYESVTPAAALFAVSEIVR